MAQKEGQIQQEQIKSILSQEESEYPPFILNAPKQKFKKPSKLPVFFLLNEEDSDSEEFSENMFNLNDFLSSSEDNEENEENKKDSKITKHIRNVLTMEDLRTNSLETNDDSEKGCSKSVSEKNIDMISRMVGKNL